MGTLVFQATLGGSVNLLGPNIATNINFTLPSADGTNGQALTTNGSGVLAFSTVVSAPAGSNTQVQFNNSGAFGASSSLTWNGSVLTSAGFSGPLNGTVGASTANTGAFTTLAASSTVTLSGGTANGVTYLNGSKVLTSGSALSFNGSSATPILTITKGTSTTLSGLNFVFGSATSSILVNDGSGEMQFAAGTSSSGYYQTFLTDSVERMRLTSTGLGIGTSSPVAPVTANRGNVSGAGQWASSAIAIANPTNTGSYSQISFGYTVGTTNASAYMGFVSTNQGTNGYGDLVFGTRAVNTDTQPTERLRLDSAGNLGLGVTPSAQLASYKSFQFGIGGNLIGRSDNAGIELSSNSYRNTSGAYIYLNTDSAASYRQYSGQHEWYNAASGTAGNTISFTQAMTLDADGWFYLGTTSTSTAGNAIVAYANSVAGQFSIGHANGTSSGNSYAGFQYNGSTIGSITQSGTTAVLYNLTSDQRLKENIQNAESSSSLIDSIQVRQFDWKSDNTHQRYGFIAQELVTVYPEAVHQPIDTDEMMAVDYSKLVPMLVKEIQSLRQRLSAANL